jgi:hypothetical protein
MRADGAGVPQLGEPGAAVKRLADQRGQARVCRVPGGCPAQVGDDRQVGDVRDRRHHRPPRDASAVRRGGEPGAHQVAVIRAEGRRVAEQRRPASVPPDQPPVGGEYPDRDVAKPGENALRAWRDVVADPPVAWRLQPGEAIQVVAFGAGELQGAGEGAGDLRRRRGRPSLLEPDHVVDGDAGEIGQFLAPQPGRAPCPARRQPGGGRCEAVAPGPDGATQAGLVIRHGSIVRRPRQPRVVLPFLLVSRPWLPRRNGTTLNS